MYLFVHFPQSYESKMSYLLPSPKQKNMVFYAQGKPSVNLITYINEYLGGGNSNIFYVHPENWGFMIQFDEHIFQVGGKKTTNRSLKNRHLGVDDFFLNFQRWGTC